MRSWVSSYTWSWWAYHHLETTLFPAYCSLRVEWFAFYFDALMDALCWDIALLSTANKWVVRSDSQEPCCRSPSLDQQIMRDSKKVKGQIHITVLIKIRFLGGFVMCLSQCYSSWFKVNKFVCSNKIQFLLDFFESYCTLKSNTLWGTWFYA